MPGVSRRKFIQNSSLLALGAKPLSSFAAHLGKKKLLLVGTETGGKSTSKGIYAYAFDSKTGELEQLGLAVEAGSPTFMAFSPNKKLLYSVNGVRQFEGKPGGGVSGFTVDRGNDKLTLINEVSSVGGGPVHIAVDHTGHCVFVANYGSGSMASFSTTADGHLNPAVSFFQYKGDPNNPKSRSHAHRVTVSPNNRFVLVNDLGLDCIHIYKLDPSTAQLTLNDPPMWKSAPGAGPRALVFHPNGKIAYCVNELKPTMDVLSWDGEKGEFTTIQNVSLVAEGYHGACAPGDVVFDKKMKFAYVTSRLDDFMATFTVAPDGELTLLNHTSCGGIRPRHLALDPTDSWLLIGNQDSGNIAVFARDKKTGHLAETGKSYPLAGPMCLLFA